MVDVSEKEVLDAEKFRMLMAKSLSKLYQQRAHIDKNIFPSQISIAAERLSMNNFVTRNCCSCFCIINKYINQQF